MAVLEPFRDDYYLWQYLPSVPAAIIFLLIFLGCFFGLCWRSWKAGIKFTIPFIIGALLEVIGYGARASAYKNTASLFRFTLQSTFTLIAPTLMAATIYMMFGRLARLMHAEKHSVVNVHLLTKIFVGGDILAFLIQGGAAGMMVIQSMATVAKALVILGLVIQVVCFGVFMVTSVIFHKRVNADFSVSQSATHIPWIPAMRLMYAVSIMIMVRSIFRLAEYAEGPEGYAMSHEWTLYVFDSLPMALSSIFFVIWFPTKLRRTVDYQATIPLTK